MNQLPLTGRPDLAGVPRRFEPLHLLGHGGGGAVWAARDRATGREVAIKLLHRGGGAAEAEALIRETIALSGLEGLGLPRLIRLGRTEDGRPYLIRELIAGEGLDGVSVDQPARVPVLLCQVADALTVVHRAGLLHGDVKPANVIVRETGGVSLVDLGLATALREGGGLTAGLTPHFAAPEVRAGGDLSPQGEVYALGVMLADHIDDHPNLVQRETLELMRAVAERATQTLAEQRFPSTDEFSQALRSALSGDVPLPDEMAMPWPVVGLESTAYALEKEIQALSPGTALLVVGDRGSGKSTLLRRALFRAALQGLPVGYVDSELDDDSLQEEAERASHPGGILFIDAPREVPRDVLRRARQRGARVVLSSDAASDPASVVGVFEVPPLPLPTVRRLLAGALPALPERLVSVVAERTNARPGALRDFVASAQGVPLAGEADVDAVLAGTELEGQDAAALLEASLSRGHFAVARGALDKLRAAGAGAAESLQVSWLSARFELGAGSAGAALELTERALATPEARSDSLLRARLETTRARALLGLGRYEDSLEALRGAEGYPAEVAAEGLAYRGLGQTLIGQGEAALDTLSLALARAEEAGSGRMVALALSCCATAEWRLGQSDAAVLSYQGSIEKATEVADAGMLASSLINLASLRKERGELAEAMRALEVALDAARRSGRLTSLHQALLNLANADLYLGRLERARGFLRRLGDPEELSPAIGAQVHGLRADLNARSGQIEAALAEYDACAEGFRALGRGREAAEALLEKILVATATEPTSDAAGAASLAEGPPISLVTLGNDLEAARRLSEGPTALLRLAEARVAALTGEPGRAEELAAEALELAEATEQKEWAWRSLALAADLADAAGKRTKAERLRGRAIEFLEDIAARLAEDLRAVFWHDPRRASLRQEGTRHSPRTSESSAPAIISARRSVTPGRLDRVTRSGTDAISRLSQTPLEQRLSRILAVNGDLAAEIELPRLAEKIVAHASELLGAERGFLLLGSQADSLTVCASRGGQGPDHEQFSRTIAGHVIDGGMPLVSVDAEHDRRLSNFQSVHLESITAVACVPVFSPQGAAIGALYLEARTGARPDFADELPTLQAFADQAAIALTNARLVREVREKSLALEQRNEELGLAEARLRELLDRRTARLREVKQELRTTKKQLGVHSGYGGLVGASAAMRRVYQIIERVKGTSVPVLIRGESGTGKEVVARAIHQGSARKDRRMLAVNCGAIPEQILESELFGHVRGAFTGADRDRRGLFRDADGGVLFLDEIGETPLKMQASLLRALQEGKVRPVGGPEEIAVDVRLVFATNCDLDEAVASGKFREDLLYRIRVVEILLPPLRERRDDIPLLIDYFLDRFAARFEQPKKTLSRRAMQELLEHPLPGNVRQLENVLLNAWVLCEGDEIQVEDLALPKLRGRGDLSPALPALPSRPHVALPRRISLSEHQRQERLRIATALESCGWNRVRAAQQLGMPRRTFYRRLKAYGL